MYYLLKSNKKAKTSQNYSIQDFLVSLNENYYASWLKGSKNERLDKQRKKDLKIHLRSIKAILIKVSLNIPCIHPLLNFFSHIFPNKLQSSERI